MILFIMIIDFILEHVTFVKQYKVWGQNLNTATIKM